MTSLDSSVNLYYTLVDLFIRNVEYFALITAILFFVLIAQGWTLTAMGCGLVYLVSVDIWGRKKKRRKYMIEHKNDPECF
ncbi:MAG: hypothetical protein WA051_00525 [Minisyncoccia bacterium]